MGRYDRRLYATQDLRVTGQQTMVYGQIARIPFDTLQPIGKVDSPHRTTFLHKLLIETDVRITYGTAPASTLEEHRSYDVFDNIRLQLPWEDRPIWKVEGGAGSKIHVAWHMRHGKRGHGAGDITLGASTTTDYDLHLELLFAAPSMCDPDGFLYPIELLQQGALELRWADGTAGTLHDANTTVTAASTSIRCVTAELIEKDSFVVPPQFCEETFEAAGLSQALPLAGRIPHWIAELPVHAAAANTDNVITDAERTLVSFDQGGHSTHRQIRTSTLTEQWNRAFALSRDERITDAVADTNPFVPLLFPRGHDYRATHLPVLTSDPLIVCTGSDTTPRYYFWTQGLNTPNRVRKAAAQAGRRFSRMLLKTPRGEVPWDTSKVEATRLPVVLA